MTTAVATSLAADIRREHDAAQQAATAAVKHAIRCGELLADAKTQVPHGEWLAWLDAHFPAGRRTAQGYMRLARHEDAQALAHLGVEGALKQLSAPRAPDAQPVLELIEHLAVTDPGKAEYVYTQTLIAGDLSEELIADYYSRRLDDAGDDPAAVGALDARLAALVAVAARTSLRAKRRYGELLAEQHPVDVACAARTA
jgi:hypothetical protein